MKNPNNKNSKAKLIAISIVIVIILLFMSIFAYAMLSGDNGHSAKKTKKSEHSDNYDKDNNHSKPVKKEHNSYYQEVDEDSVVYEDGIRFVDSHLIFDFKKGYSEDEIRELIENLDGQIIGYIEISNTYQVNFSNKKSMQELQDIIDQYENDPNIDAVYLEEVYDKDDISVDYNTDPWESASNPIELKGWNSATPDGANWWAEMISMPEVWKMNQNFQSVNVGLIDSFFDLTNEDLSPAFLEDHVTGQTMVDVTAGYLNALDDERNGRTPDIRSGGWAHGSNCAGIIGARNNNFGICGVSQNANLYGVSAYGPDVNPLYNTSLTWMDYFERLLNQGVQVISISMGKDVLSFAAQRVDQGLDNRENDAMNALNRESDRLGRFLHDCIEENDNFLIAKSAGNLRGYDFVQTEINALNPYGYRKAGANDDNSSRIHMECEAEYDFLGHITDQEVRDHILVVGSVDEHNHGKGSGGDEYANYDIEISSFSNIGNRVNIYAPGGFLKNDDNKTGNYPGVLSAYPNHQVDYMSGTSQATPMVAGVAALVWGADPSLSWRQVRDAILNQAQKNSDSTESDYKVLDAYTAVNSVTKRTKAQVDGVSRDVVLVLDSSGSMYGDPLDQTKDAAQGFVDTVFEKNSTVGVVNYSDEAVIATGLSKDENVVKNAISSVYAGGCTNTYDGLVKADELLSASTADRRIIVLMSDGLPNEGAMVNGSFEEGAIQYAETLKNKGYYIYTLGFFSEVDGGSLAYAQDFMARVASPGLHYEVATADDLLFFFDDIANQISGKQYVYIRIECPVNVKVSSGGETLSSDPENENKRTGFGTLSYEEIETDDGSIDIAKILRLDADKNYDIKIDGYDDGLMDYIVSYPNSKGEYKDERKFPNIKVTPSMKAKTNTKKTDTSSLSVDLDGDGKYEKEYLTKSNGKMEEKKDHTLLYIIIGVSAAIVMLVLILAFIMIRKQKKPVRYLVGRSPECDIRLNSMKVSRIHAELIRYPDGSYIVIDRSSRGTYCSGERLNKGMQYKLPKGSVIFLGDENHKLTLE